jgi:DNA polymerase-1
VRLLRRELRTDVTDTGQGLLDFGDGDSEASEAMLTARAVAEVADALDAELERTDGTRLLREVELPAGRRAGADGAGRHRRRRARADGLEAEFASGVREAQEDAWAAIDRRDVNLGSPKQLQEVLFDQLGLPKTKRTKTGYTTDADALTELYAKSRAPVPRGLAAPPRRVRLRVTVEGLLKSVADDGRIHTTYLQTIAATGRLSSTDPNLQNVPIRTEEGRRIREMFVVGEGFESLMSADYSQIEMRVMAHLSGDDGLIEAFRSGEDLHSFVARGSSGSSRPTRSPRPCAPRSRRCPTAWPTGCRRSACPASCDLHRRGQDPHGRILPAVRRGPRLPAPPRRRCPAHRLHRDDAGPAALPARPHQRQPAAPRDGRADGPQRPDPGVGRRHHEGRHAPGRRGPAGPGCASRILLQVHDELVLEIAPGERDEVEELVRREMGAAVALDVPLDVSVGVGRSWHDAAH